MARRFAVSVYGGEELGDMFEKVKAYYLDKNPDITMSDSAICGKMIEDAYNKIEGRETNANRITTIIQRLDVMEESSEKRLSSLESAVRELVGIIKGDQNDQPYVSDYD